MTPPLFVEELVRIYKSLTNIVVVSMVENVPVLPVIKSQSNNPLMAPEPVFVGVIKEKC